VSRGKEVTLTVCGVVFGAMWLLAAAGKIASPLSAYELTVYALPAGTTAKAALTLAVALEVFLGAAMCLRVVRSFVWSLAGLLVAIGLLLLVRSRAEELVPCGCFGDFLGTTVDGALVRDGVLVAIHAALILWSRIRTAP
jgi:hypothetical protein